MTTFTGWVHGVQEDLFLDVAGDLLQALELGDGMKLHFDQHNWHYLLICSEYNTPGRSTQLSPYPNFEVSYSFV